MYKISGNILIVDDEPELRNLLARILELEGYEVFTSDGGKNALKKLATTTINVVITDIQMPGMNGIDLIEKIKKISPITEVICLTAYGKITDGVQAIKNGAYDYLEKDNYRTKIIPLVAKAAEKSKLQFEVLSLRKKIQGKENFNTIIGHSKAIQNAIVIAQKVAPTDATVLLSGPTGTGKEIFANAIHNESKRATENLVTINCAALSKEILESELFGHKQGAFTGAIKDKQGLFEAAHNGTIFLDEVGELELDLQAKILRVLENGTFIKLSATNRNLQEAVKNGTFREDLYFRLSMFEIRLPSLNERQEDILPLANHFLLSIKIRLNKNINGITAAYEKALEKHYWSGNIRELKNLIERSVILEDSELLTVDTLPFNFQDQLLLNEKKPVTLKEIEKQHILRILQHTGENKTQTAKILDIGLTTLYAKLKEYHI